MAILHVVQYSLPEMPCGYSLRTQAIVREQAARGLDPVVLTSPRHPRGPESEVGGVRHYRCAPERPGRSVWLRDRERVTRLASRIEEIAAARGDLRALHAHSPLLCGLAARRAARRLGLPMIYEVRGLWEEGLRRSGLPARVRYRLARWMEVSLARAADAVVVISRGLKQEFVRRGVPEAKLHIVGNGVDPRVFSPRTPSPEWRARRDLSDGPVLLYLGALRAYEGVDLLLAAFPDVRRHHPQAQLLIVGDGEARGELAAQEDPAAGIHVLPPAPHEDTPEYYAAADLVVYPRRATRAAELVTPLKPLEAMAMGKTIVASDVGGLRELLTEGETARLFPAGSAEALVRACRELLSDEAARRRLGERARQVAVEQYDWRNVVARYLEVYRAAGMR